MLQWKVNGAGQHEGYSGELLIGLVTGHASGVVPYDATVGVSMRWIQKSKGEAASINAGKCAVERAWKVWLRRSRLQAVGRKVAAHLAPAHSASPPR